MDHVVVHNVRSSECVSDAGAVDATVTIYIAGCPGGLKYGVTLVRDSHNGQLRSWGNRAHWISGPTINDLTTSSLDAIVAAVAAH